MNYLNNNTFPHFFKLNIFYNNGKKKPHKDDITSATESGLS